MSSSTAIAPVAVKGSSQGASQGGAQGGLPMGTRIDSALIGQAAGGHEDQYVTFTVGAEEYGVNILSVREIRGWTQESRLPNLPDYVRGVINLRGIIIPIFDLRARFGGGPTQVTKRHVVVVMQVGERTRGVLVDAISDILAIGPDAIKPPPDVDSGLIDAEYLSGLYTADDRMVTLLSVETLFAGEHADPDAAPRPAASAERP